MPARGREAMTGLSLLAADPCSLSHNVVRNFRTGPADPVAARRTLLATTMTGRQQCRGRKQRDSNLSGQPFVTMGGGALPLPLPIPTQPATLTATRVATKTVSTFFIGVPLCSRHARYTSRLAAPLVALCRQWFDTVSHFEADCVLGDTGGQRSEKPPR